VQSRKQTQTRNALRSLAVATVAGLCAASGLAAHAQSTAANVFGWGPAGGTVKVRSSTGLERHATINDKGHYIVHALPLGTYTVSLEREGKSVDTRSNIGLAVGRNAEIDFACPNDRCAR
jgi:hypothetical protein